MNASGTFQEDNWYAQRIRLTVAFGFQIDNLTETR
jgi:hypothetical protein